MAAKPKEVCAKCGQVVKKPNDPKDTDKPTRGKKWLRVPIVVPDISDKEALEEKMDILQERYSAAVGSKMARFLVLDFALQQAIDSGVVPSEEGG